MRYFIEVEVGAKGEGGPLALSLALVDTPTLRALLWAFEFFRHARAGSRCRTR